MTLQPLRTYHAAARMSRHGGKGYTLKLFHLFDFDDRKTTKQNKTKKEKHCEYYITLFALNSSNRLS